MRRGASVALAVICVALGGLTHGARGQGPTRLDYFRCEFWSAVSSDREETNLFIYFPPTNFKGQTPIENTAVSGEFQNLYNMPIAFLGDPKLTTEFVRRGLIR